MADVSKKVELQSYIKDIRERLKETHDDLAIQDYLLNLDQFDRELEEINEVNIAECSSS